MAYLWVKALHVAGVLVFVGGTLAQALFLAAHRNDAATDATRRFRRLTQQVTIPALLVALAGGLALASLGRWFPAPWLVGKAVLVLALLGVHGFQAGRLRRLAGDRPAPAPPLHAVVLALVTLIVVLAVVKPALAGAAGS